MEDNGCIYLVTNKVNGKCYVGQYKYPEPSKRWLKHIQSAKGNSPYALHSAIRKYGEDKFKVETIRTCKHSDLGEMEGYYAEQYGCYIWDPTPGYNMVWCQKNFRLGITHTQEVREKLRQANTGRKQSDETIAKRVIALTGQKHSQEACDNISCAKRANPISSEGLRKLSELRKGKKMSKETRENMKKGHANRKLQILESESSTLPSRPKLEFKCDECDKILPKSSSLKLHKRTHTQEKPYVCELCDKPFACGSNLDEHMFTHNPKSFKCEICDKLLSSPRTLKRHTDKFHTTISTIQISSS